MINVFRGLGEIGTTYLKQAVAERTGPFKFEPGELHFHGTRNPPNNLHGTPVNPGDSFEAQVHFFVVPKAHIEHAEIFAKGAGFSWKRQPVSVEKAEEGHVLGVISDIGYRKTFLGGIRYIPAGATVHVVEKRSVEPMSDEELAFQRKMQEARIDQFKI